jgi:hypothetical protein
MFLRGAHLPLLTELIGVCKEHWCYKHRAPTGAKSKGKRAVQQVAGMERSGVCLRFSR